MHGVIWYQYNIIAARIDQSTDRYGLIVFIVYIYNIYNKLIYL